MNRERKRRDGSWNFSLERTCNSRSIEMWCFLLRAVGLDSAADGLGPIWYLIEPPTDVPGVGRVCMLADPAGAVVLLIKPIGKQCRTGAQKIPKRFLLRRGHVDRREFSHPVHARDLLGVLFVRVDPVSGIFRNQGRRDPAASNPQPGQEQEGDVPR